MSSRYLVVELIKKFAEGPIIKPQSIESAICKQYPGYFKQSEPK